MKRRKNKTYDVYWTLDGFTALARVNATTITDVKKKLRRLLKVHSVQLIREVRKTLGQV